MLPSLYKYRSFIWTHALADLRHRYAGSNLGIVWNVLHPLTAIAVYSLVFGWLMESRSPSVPGRFGYTIYLCCGFFPWIAFSECIQRGCNAFSANAAYLKKLPIPEQVFVAQTAASATFGLAISFGLLITISLAMGIQPTWHWLLLPIPLIFLQLTGFGIGLIVGTINVFFTDVGQFTTVALQLAFWLTPIIFAAEKVPPAFRPLLLAHPFTPALMAIRALFLGDRFPAPPTVIAMIAWAFVTITLGAFVLRRLRHEIRDVL